LLATISCLRSGQAETWWTKSGVVNNLANCQHEHLGRQQALASIGRLPRPLLVSQYVEGRRSDLLVLSRMVDPRIDWLGTRDLAELRLPADRDIVIYKSPPLVEQLEIG